MEESTENNIVLAVILLNFGVLQKSLSLNLMRICMMNIIRYKKMKTEITIG